MKKPFISVSVLIAMLICLTSTNCGGDDPEGTRCDCSFYGWTVDEEGNKVPSYESISRHTYEYDEWHATGYSSCESYSDYWKKYFEELSIDYRDVRCVIAH